MQPSSGVLLLSIFCYFGFALAAEAFGTCQPLPPHKLLPVNEGKLVIDVGEGQAPIFTDDNGALMLGKEDVIVKFLSTVPSTTLTIASSNLKSAVYVIVTYNDGRPPFDNTFPVSYVIGAYAINIPTGGASAIKIQAVPHDNDLLMSACAGD